MIFAAVSLFAVPLTAQDYISAKGEKQEL